MIAFLNGQYLAKDRVCISPDDRGFLFADGLYEVVRFYHNRPFRLREHRQRLENGARELRFNRCEFPEFDEVLMNLIEKNRLEKVESAIVYFQVTRGAAPRSHRFPPPETPLTVYAFAREFFSAVEEQENGAGAILVEDDRWGHCDLKTIALLPNTLAHQKARDAGAVEALFVREGLIQEGTHSNVAVVKGGIFYTPPLTRHVLPGITRQAVIELCREADIEVKEAAISKNFLLEADEVMIIGTTVEITPIVRIDGKLIGSGRPGPLTQQLQTALFRLTHNM
ncbi:aminotransferase class IV [Caldithrix abyssi DSM 13497]|uniref:Aminotransferase class IV n=1 Tax=Caldithrix abyssi DSM 13497 TaxID=880073 RepID=H1XYK8_CALAY|nr:aminotransferase class IV [Caldithrix abyssi]APF19715.1 D-alanine transaminase [Caldithrix abyssi DSM 13497]EHO39826.1 aminotransferase class IV [Caldithrix abyssi DSM 13497]